MIQGFKRLLGHLFRHRVSMFGVIMTSVFGLVLVAAIGKEIVSPSENAYASAMIFTIVPLLFLLGLALIPLGAFLQWRRNRREGHVDGPPRWGTRSLGGAMAFAVIATAVNLVLVGSAAFTAYSYMETPQFCGTACHEPMAPEWHAYQRSAHSRVKCVDCHVGDGAQAGLEAKLRGLEQLWGVITGDFERPISTPVHTLRSAQDTCMKCHWPPKFRGDQLFHRVHYSNDEENSALVNAFRLHVGGRHPVLGEPQGIHWHADADIEVRYEALDAKRSKIGKIQVFEKGELVREYLPPEGWPTDVLEVRSMDCVDCHNRPSHAFERSAAVAIDGAFARGALNADVPFLRKVGLPILSRNDIERAKAGDVFLSELKKAYADQHPDVEVPSAEIESAAAGLSKLYLDNVFPNMKVQWGTYPDHMGHPGNTETLGCFRCHNEKHATSEGKALSQDCGLCHEQLADEEAPDELDEDLQRQLFGAKR